MEVVYPIKSRKDINNIKRYLRKKNKRDYVIFLLGINIGLRVSDILNLNIEDVKERDTVYIREKKTGKSKSFPINTQLRRAIDDYLATCRCKTYALDEKEPLFVGKKHCRLERSCVYRFLKEACKTMKVDVKAGTHTMRKSFGYHFYKKYKDIALLQNILNHSSPAITLRYIGIMQEEIDKSYKLFAL